MSVKEIVDQAARRLVRARGSTGGRPRSARGRLRAARRARRAVLRAPVAGPERRDAGHHAVHADGDGAGLEPARRLRRSVLHRPRAVRRRSAATRRRSCSSTRASRSPRPSSSPGALCAAVAAITAVPLLRLRGVYFSVGTIGVLLAAQAWFINWSYVGQTTGVIMPNRGTLGVRHPVLPGRGPAGPHHRRRLGPGAQPDRPAADGRREDEVRPRELGVNGFRVKLITLTISAFLVGLAGAMNAFQQLSLEPYSAFSHLVGDQHDPRLRDRRVWRRSPGRSSAPLSCSSSSSCSRAHRTSPRCSMAQSACGDPVRSRRHLGAGARSGDGAHRGLAAEAHTRIARRAALRRRPRRRTPRTSRARAGCRGLRGSTGPRLTPDAARPSRYARTCAGVPVSVARPMSSALT